MRATLWISFLSLILVLPSARAKSRLRPHQLRRFHRGLVKRVQVSLTKTGADFLWQTPSGKIIRYRGEKIPPGLLAKLKKYLKQGRKILAVGGRYRYIGAGTGAVEPAFAYAIKRVWRGVRVVKLDGIMPLYTASILPTKPGQKPKVYEIRGIVHSQLNHRDNKLVCLYGTWFDLLDAPHSMLSQTNGIKGRSLFFFAKRYQRPRTWRQLTDPKERWRAFQAAKRRQKKGLPPPKPKVRVPILTPSRLKRYQKICLARLSPLEKKFSMPIPSTPQQPTSRPR